MLLTACLVVAHSAHLPQIAECALSPAEQANSQSPRELAPQEVCIASSHVVAFESFNFQRTKAKRPTISGGAFAL
jgi:hypothetical protein